MRANLDNWTLVLTGQWNVRIFRPEWVIENLLEGGQVNVEAFLTPGIAQIRLVSEEVVLVPKDDRIIIGVKAPGDNHLAKIEEIAIKMLSLLAHTPVNAFGVNFSFIEDDPPQSLLDLFQTKDSGPLVKFGGRINLTELKHSLRFEGDDGILNLKQSVKDGRVTIDFNFHYQAKSAEDASKRLKGIVLRCKQRAYALLEQVHGLIVGEEENGDSFAVREQVQ